jgi:hypothetical protein
MEMTMPDTSKEGKTIPDNKSHNPPSTGKPSPGAGHSPTPTEDNEKDVKDVDGIKG